MKSLLLFSLLVSACGTDYELCENDDGSVYLCSEEITEEVEYIEPPKYVPAPQTEYPDIDRTPTRPNGGDKTYPVGKGH